MSLLITLGALCLLIIITVFKACIIVPQRMVFIVERLGKYQNQLHAGLHFLVPFIDKISYKHSLKEMAIDVPVQVCITRDNISVEVDGILYLQVMDPQKASYGINNYLFATTQIAQTTMRSVIGKMDLDQTFEERENINGHIVEAADKASDPWGIKVTRYEIKDIKPPKSIKDAMEKQMRAEREKRAVIAESEGEQQARINRAEGERQETIARSEGSRKQRMNEADGKAYEIEEVSKATSEGLKLIAEATQSEGGDQAVKLKIAEQYLVEFGRLAKTNNTMIIPSNLSDLSSVIASATSIYKQGSKTAQFTDCAIKDNMD